ncbi:MAG: AglZ/HisF2 family acetamidino modification protein [Cyclobacteriaceae bacterium]
MALPRVIPILLLRNKGLVKSIRFKDHKYIGDPINTVKILNEKEVDELAFIDIDASRENREPNYQLLSEIASECFMPLAYGGGVSSLKQIRILIQSGIEKIIINHHALVNPGFVKSAIDAFGSSTIVGAMDIKKNFFGSYQVYTHVGTKSLSKDAVTYAESLEALGVGELLVNNVDLDGMMSGYDLSIVKKIAEAVDIPVIACGGAGTVDDIDRVINQANASAAGAGSMFVYRGKHRAVLITYPEYKILNEIFRKKKP